MNDICPNHTDKCCRLYFSICCYVQNQKSVVAFSCTNLRFFFASYSHTRTAKIIGQLSFPTKICHPNIMVSNNNLGCPKNQIFLQSLLTFPKNILPKIYHLIHLAYWLLGNLCLSNNRWASLCPP